jgi:hypothetical protein
MRFTPRSRSERSRSTTAGSSQIRRCPSSSVSFSKLTLPSGSFRAIAAKAAWVMAFANHGRFRCARTKIAHFRPARLSNTAPINRPVTVRDYGTIRDSL